MTEHIDEKDARLIALLRADARAPVAELARQLGLARTTVQARIDRLLAKGVIAGFTVRTGDAVAAPIRATVLVAIAPRTGPAVVARLRALPNVEAVVTVSGRADLIVDLSARTTRDLDTTLDDIAEAKGVQSSESFIHLSTKIDRRG
ncbi:Lrp/AsnC family transcriptional regulator [Marivita sp. S6314]|uniref:Lrp/AsnC family transcriptional regulator n=1 Tax=Marivita sp. S6314 TaxID=2926406 RepID=UPI001FF2BA9A|nr:Lrp/AsnC family transcriptional regulator [Marivita sp. S6314]MCK0149106.1 Lrp/AsnC family transcriptional regulator [Marivita sp. S6314]